MVTSKKTGNKIAIYLNDILHVAFDLEIYVTLQSWIDYTPDITDSFKIELTIGNKDVLLEYNTRAKWIEVLNELDKHVNTVL